jgi:hypothetical protein
MEIHRTATADELKALSELTEKTQKIFDLLKAVPHEECESWHEIANLGLKVGHEIRTNIPNEQEFWRVVMTYAAWHEFHHRMKILTKAQSSIEYLMLDPTYGMSIK